VRGGRGGKGRRSGGGTGGPNAIEKEGVGSSENTLMLKVRGGSESTQKNESVKGPHDQTQIEGVTGVVEGGTNAGLRAFRVVPG